MINTRSPLVTIGIPTYNRAKDYLPEALASALKQTYDRLEVVISDNCSPDHTHSFITSLGDRRIRYFRQSHPLSANQNFNFCLANAHGAYFLLLHDDDLIDNDFIETCMRAINDDARPGIIRTGTRVIDGARRMLRKNPNRVAGLSTTDFFLAWFADQTSFYFCSTLYNTEKLRAIGGFGSKTNRFQDVVAGAQLAARFGRADIYEVKASFRRHGGNYGSASNIADWCEDSLYLLDLMVDLSPERKEVIKRRGLKFFARKNYNAAAAIRSPFERFSTYMMIHKKFDREYSPVRYLYHKHVLRRIFSLQKRMSRSFAHSGK